MPSALQKRVLIGLESGAKLHEILREPHMPGAKLVDEWRNAPEFEAEYLLAAADGAAKRQKLAEKTEKRRYKTARRCDFTFVGQPKTVAGTEDDERRQQFSRQLTAIIGDDYITPPGRPDLGPVEVGPAPKLFDDNQPVGPYQKARSTYFTHPFTPAPMSEPTPNHPSNAPSRPNPVKMTPEVTASRQQECLKLLAQGLRSPDVFAQVTGSGGVMLAQWRKEPKFAARWDAASHAGRVARTQAALRRVSPAQPEAPVRVARIIGPTGSQPTLEKEIAYQFGEQQEALARQELLGDSGMQLTPLRHPICPPVLTGDPEPDEPDEPDELTQIAEQLERVNREMLAIADRRAGIVARLKAFALEMC